MEIKLDSETQETIRELTHALLRVAESLDGFDPSIDNSKIESHLADIAARLK